MIILSDTEETEVEHLNELGLHSEALDAVERELQTRENTAILWEAITTAMVNKRFNLAVEYAERLKVAPGIKKRHLQLVSLAYNYAGRSLEAYQCCREAIDRTDTPNEAGDYYTMACRASSIGLQKEAFANILIALVFLPRNDEDILRKAFLDSELAGAWGYAESAEPTLAQALSVYFPDWKYVVQRNTPAEPERWIDHSDLKHIPSEFHSLLKPRCPSTLLSTPLTAALNPDLHRRYLKWQDDQVQPRLLAFSNYIEKVTKLLEDFQGSFATFQAHKGRFGAARNHLLQILKKSPDADPSRLPEIPLLAPLITEFRNQFAESPEAFSRLVHRSYPGLSQGEFEALPSANRRSGTAALLLGNGHYNRKRRHEAVQAWASCAQIWPWDETPLLNLVRGLIETNRKNEATRALGAIRSEAISQQLRRKIEFNIHCEDWAPDTFGRQDGIPIPSFSGFYPGANQEFLQWLEESENSNRSLTP